MALKLSAIDTILALFRMPLTACRYVAQKPSERGLPMTPPHQVVENLDADSAGIRPTPMGYG